MSGVEAPPDAPDDEPEEPEEPDEDDALDWAAADVVESDYLEDDGVRESTEPVADGSQDMPEEPAGWARPANLPRSAWGAV